MPADLITIAEATSAWDAFTSLPVLRQAAMISAASAAVSAACNRTLGFDIHDDVHRPESTGTIWIREYPVIRIVTIEAGPAGSRSPLDPADYALRNAGRMGELELYRGFLAGYRYPDRPYGGHPGSGDVRVVYEAGYVATADPDHPERPVCPPDLKEAVVQAVRMASVGIESAGLKSESVDGRSYTLADGVGLDIGMPPSVAWIVGRYRRKSFA